MLLNSPALRRSRRFCPGSAAVPDIDEYRPDRAAEERDLMGKGRITSIEERRGQSEVMLK